MVGLPQDSSCYCLEPHELSPGEAPPPLRHWTERRATMVERLRRGEAFGYLAYVDGRPAGWVNASRRADCALFRRGDGDAGGDVETVCVACFAIAPPYRRHGLARRLLDRVVADAADRGATGVEAYPGDGVGDGDGPGELDFRGPRPMFEAAGFTEVVVRSHDVVMRRPVR